MFTRATTPVGFPYAWRMPVCSRSAPAHDNILLMRITWNGCARTRRWNASLPANVAQYLLEAMRAASSASEDSCSSSSENMCTTEGNSSIVAFFRPMSKMRIFESGTPRRYLDLMNGLFLR